MAGETPQSSPSSSPSASPPASAPASAPASSPASSSPAPTTVAPAAPASSAPAAPPAARPGYIPENHWDATAGKVKDEKAFTDWVNGNAAAVAAEQSRKLTLPAPDKYEPTLPADFKPPEGLQFQIDAKDPLITQYRTLAHEFGLDQTQFSKGLGLIAALRVGEQQQIKAAYDAEVAKLGAAGTARVDAVSQWINAVGGAEAKPLADMMKIAPLAATVQAFENLMKKFQTQGGASFSPQHREPEPQRPTAEAWAKMSFGERMDFARKHQSPAGTQ